jgi:16S rRNA (cytosine1402-N4)-methyltransferase
LESDFYHEPVLLNEVMALLLANKTASRAKVYVDGTLGGGGYTRKILDETGSEFRVIGIDRDENSVKYSQKNLIGYKDRLIIVNDNFSNIASIIKSSLKSYERANVSGIVLDLGLSTYQLEHEYGFSYQKDTALDMRAGQDAEITANEVLNGYNEKELFRIFKEYGELKYSRQITMDIIEYRQKKKIETTRELAELLKKKIPPRYLNKDLSKLFQALRIEVNGEMENLKKVLEDSVELLEEGARITVVSYHSLEDRIVKNFFRANDKLKVITKKPVTASEKEVKYNPRARSAKLRAAEKIR